MSQTGRLGLPYIITAQAQKEVTHNEGLNRLDAFVTPVVADIANAPPASPTVGDLYIVGAQSPTGDFVWLRQISWRSISPGAGCFIRRFNGWMRWWRKRRAAWRGMAPHGCRLALLCAIAASMHACCVGRRILIFLATTQSVTNIPNRSTVLAVNTRVITALTGTVGSFGVGVSGDTSRYGNGIGTGQDSTNIGLTYHPVSYYSDTPVEITPDSGSITGGVVRVNVQYMAFRGPWNW